MPQGLKLYLIYKFSHRETENIRVQYMFRNYEYI